MSSCIIRSVRFLLIIAVVCLPGIASSQVHEPLPLDPRLRYGVLDNGLTYYIQHNELPKGQADFYIAQKVGSTLEEEGQEGLAHFLEHMAFNGTENFPGKTLLQYLESIGVKFGTNLNAYTSSDQTVYNITNVPVARESVIDSCLLILHDWACAIALEEEEIDSERGVIREEWRTGRNATRRIYEQILPVMYTGSRYADRLPIGKLEVIDNFAYSTLRDYYHRWYRPDQQGIIVIGDFDVNMVEAKVKELFGKIKMPENAQERVYFPVPNNKEPIVAIGSDKEQGRALLTVFYKHDILPEEVKASASGLVLNYMKICISRMLNARLSEITRKPNPPFIAADGGYGTYFLAKTKDAFSVSSSTGENDIIKGMEAIMREVERMDRYGFTAGEYERARANFLMGLEATYKEKDKQRNGYYSGRYVSHFIDGGSIMGAEDLYELQKAFVPEITVEQINQFARSLVTDENIVVRLMAPEKEGVTLPTEEELLAVLRKAKTEDVEPYVDTVSDEPLIPDMPTPGKITKISHSKEFDAEIWTLSNGVKVVVKPTDFKDDEVMMVGTSKGGNTLFKGVSPENIKALNAVISLGGIGNFSATDLPKVLAGKRVSLISRVLDESEYVKGSASPKDLETLMQLTYLSFTAPRKDQEAFESWKQRAVASLENIEKNPTTALNDSIVSTVYSNHPLMTRMKKEDYAKINYDSVIYLYNDRFKDGSDFVFTFVGNIDKKELKTFVEQYLATLPAIYRKESYGDHNIEITKGVVSNHFTKEVETPKTTVLILYSGKCKYDMENTVKMTMLSQIMNSVYLKTLREEEGGTYGAGVGGSIDPYDNEYLFNVSFDTNGELKDKLISIVHREVEKIAKEGPSEEDFNKVKEYLLKKHKENLKENSYLQSVIDTYYLRGTDQMNDYEKVVNKQSLKSIQKFAAKLFSQGNMLEVVMDGIAKQ